MRNSKTTYKNWMYLTTNVPCKIQSLWLSQVLRFNNIINMKFKLQIGNVVMQKSNNY